MKWTIQELIKNQNTDYTFEGTIDFSSTIENTDIIAISPVHVEGEYEIYDNEEFIFYLRISCTLTLACALTLEEVDYPLDFDVEEVFTTFDNEDYNKVEGITIDLLPIIWSNIILEKPMRVLSENAYEKYQHENVEVEVDETENAFAALKDYKK